MSYGLSKILPLQPKDQPKILRLQPRISLWRIWNYQFWLIQGCRNKECAKAEHNVGESGLDDFNFGSPDEAGLHYVCWCRCSSSIYCLELSIS